MATRSGGSGSGSGSSGGRPRAQRASGGQRTAATGRGAAASRTDKSIEAFRNALERSVTLSRGRLQEAVDDAVRRGRITRTDANELMSNLITRSRQYREELMKQLDRLLDQAQRELEARSGPARRRASAAAGRAARAARDAADAPLARADRLRRRTGVRARGPISAYDQLTVSQVKARLRDLTPAELRTVRQREERGKDRKGILDEIDRRLK